jgi:hypothetical protein
MSRERPVSDGQRCDVWQSITGIFNTQDAYAFGEVPGNTPKYRQVDVAGWYTPSPLAVRFDLIGKTMPDRTMPEGTCFSPYNMTSVAS